MDNFTTIIESLPFSKHVPPQRGTYADNKLETIQSFINFTRGKEFPRWPLEVFLELSNVCDLKCAMCPTFSALHPARGTILKETERGFLDSEKLSQPLEAVLTHALNVHCFGYGEPTIHPQFREFISYISQFEVLIDFFSNGMHLDKSLAEFLVENKIYSVSISFSGTTKEQYENVYIGGVFEQVLAGIKNLTEAKLAANSIYPIIEINSLAFNHHVLALDKFVDLMAEHGANIIHLKSLQAHTAIPQLAQHVSVLRPWVEGEILEQAQQRATLHGITLSTTQYDLTRVKTEDEVEKAKSHCLVENGGAHNETQELVEIGKFKQIAKSMRPLIHSSQKSAQSQAEHRHSPLEFDDFSNKIGDFYCLEPFKTLYVRKDGKTKPCCFGNNNGPVFGDLNINDASEIWSGTRANALREGIIHQHYSKALCADCISHRFGPSDHNVLDKLHTFSNWYSKSFYSPEITAHIEAHKTLGCNKEIALRAKSNLRKKNIAGTTSLIDPRIALLGARLSTRALRAESIAELISGHLDQVKDGILFGWAWTPLFPNLPLTIVIYDQGVIIGSIKANAYRKDLEESKIGGGNYSFAFRLPQEPTIGKKFSLRARVEGTAFYLRNEPIIVIQ